MKTTLERERGSEGRSEAEPFSNLLRGLDDLAVLHDHHDAVEQDGGDDDEGEERVDEDVDGHPADGGEGRHDPEGVLPAEAEDVLPLADDDEGLKRRRERARVSQQEVFQIASCVLRDGGEGGDPQATLSSSSGASSDLRIVFGHAPSPESSLTPISSSRAEEDRKEERRSIVVVEARRRLPHQTFPSFLPQVLSLPFILFRVINIYFLLALSLYLSLRAAINGARYLLLSSLCPAPRRATINESFFFASLLDRLSVACHFRSGWEHAGGRTELSPSSSLPFSPFPNYLSLPPSQTKPIRGIKES